MDAAIGLREFTGKTSERALLDAVEHDMHYLVRCNALNSLTARWKVTLQHKEHWEMLELIAHPNAVQYRGEVMTEEFQKNLAEGRERLEKLRDKRELAEGEEKLRVLSVNSN